jgi:hypothetical protein
MLLIAIVAQLKDCFWEIFLEYSQKNLHLKYIYFKFLCTILLRFVIKICQKCHFQSFLSPFTIPFIT